MRKLCVLALLCLSATAYATISVSGNLKDASGAAVTSGSSVRFWLRGCSGNQPIVSGTALVNPNGGNTVYFDFKPDGTGAISGTLYSASEVSCGGHTNVIWWGMQAYSNGRPGPESAVDASANININSPTLLSSNPVADIGTSVLQGYVFTQASTATTWTINHNLNAAVSVEFFDSSGALFWPNTVVQTSSNVLTATFTTPQSGTAVLHKAGVISLATGTQAILSNPGADQSITGSYALTLNTLKASSAVLNGSSSGSTTLQSSATASGTATLPANSGTIAELNLAQTFTAAQTVKILNNVRYADQFSGADIGAQLNAAYADLPASGGTIYVSAKSDGTCYSFSTPITFTTVGKFVQLVGLGTASTTSGNLPQGICLNYTPTTATSAMTLDYTPTGGGGYRTGHGLQNIFLTNGTTYTNGGSGSSATGINIGPSNGGAHKGIFLNITVLGFGKGVYFPGTNNVGWGLTFLNSSFAYNNTGVKYDIDRENDSYIGCDFTVNGIGLDLNHFGTEVTLVGGSVDSNTTSGVHMADGAVLHASDVHWENFGGTTAHYVDGGATASSTIDIKGGYAYDDIVSSTTDYWFKAGEITTGSLIIQSNGRTIAGGTLFIANTRGKYDYFNVTPATLTNAMIYAAPAIAIDGRNSIIEAQTYNLGETTVPTGLTGKDLLWGDSTAHRPKMLNNNAATSLVVAGYLSGSDASVDLASVASGACTTERTVAITGAAFGNPVMVQAGTALEAGTFLTGKVSSSGNTKWQFCNVSGGAVDRASDSYTITVLQ